MRSVLGVLIVLALFTAPAGAQDLPPSLNVHGVGEPVAVSVAMHRGYPSYPAWTLRGLGARVDYTGSGGQVVFGSDTLSFQVGSPFFRGSDRSWQLVEPPYREGGILYLPHQFFAEWLPGRYPDQVQWRGGRLALKSAGQPTAGEGGEPLGRPAPARPVVIVDAGHGGPDPGAVGPSGLKEKDVVLQVSRRLAKVLAERGYEVRMTRTGDTLIPLADRPHMANEWRGSRPGLFLSIHANQVGDRRVTGFETFFLSDARTEDERRVAELENSAVAYESPNRVVAADDLGFILNNLRNDFYMRASHRLAGVIQEEFARFHRGRNRGVKQAPFRVLVGATMPAVLVEVGFISNPQEERQLASGSFQVRVAEAIADAVDRFFESQGELWETGAP